MMGLTGAQARCLEAIKAEIGSGHPPTLRRLADRLGLRAHSSISRIIQGLEDRGTVRRVPNSAGHIEVIELNPARAVVLNAEIDRLVRAYARSHAIEKDTAANELLRQVLGAAA